MCASRVPRETVDMAMNKTFSMSYGISGRHIEGFREGWAILPFNHKPHYWRRKDLSLVFTSLCGFEIDQTNYHPGAQRQFAPGVFMVDRCKLCIRKHPLTPVERPALFLHES